MAADEAPGGRGGLVRELRVGCDWFELPDGTRIRVLSRRGDRVRFAIDSTQRVRKAEEVEGERAEAAVDNPAH